MTNTIEFYKEKNRNAYNGLLEDLKHRKQTESFELIDKAFKHLLKERGEDILSGSKDKIHSVIDAARIAVKDIGLGRTSVVSMMLFHSSIDKVFDYKAIEKEYGKDISFIVNGLASVHGIGEKSVSSQAENFRRLLLNLAKDVRVILIILAEQLENMRMMKYMNPQEQIRTASEASYLYSPLAHRLGLYLIKSEMEDLSLKYKDRETYDMIACKLDDTMHSRKKFIDEFIRPIKETLEKQGFNFEIKGRPKSIHSIWNKMHKKEVEFEDIYDLFAIRIILKSELKSEKADCWQVYSAVTDIYQPNPLRMRDWISVPKTNGYESLHTTVIGPDGKWVEVQIRTERMNEIAEKGVAAHWKYKGGEGENGIESWLGKIREILETPEPDAGDFIDDFKLSLYSKEIFVFTPRGDLKKFPANASVLDFAYDIHTEVGSTCVGAKLNGKVVPIRHRLQNGDRVEILTSKTQKPNLDWLNFVVTSKAQKKVRQVLNEEKVREAENGKEIIKRRFKNWKIEYNDEAVRKLLKKYKLPNAQEFYYLISINKIDLAEVKEHLNEVEVAVDENIQALENLEASKHSTTDEHFDQFLIIDEKIVNIDYKLARCCNPIMGDNVFGFVTISEGIKIHRTNCPNAVQLIGKYGYRVVNARWSRRTATSIFPVDLKIRAEDQAGLLNGISEVLSKDFGVSIRSVKFDVEDGEFKGNLGLYVRDLEHLDAIIRKLNSIKGVYQVNRLDGKS